MNPGSAVRAWACDREERGVGVGKWVQTRGNGVAPDKELVGSRAAPATGNQRGLHDPPREARHSRAVYDPRGSEGTY